MYRRPRRLTAEELDEARARVHLEAGIPFGFDPAPPRIAGHTLAPDRAQRQGTGRHEAGHAVAALALRVGVWYATAQKDRGGWLGHVHHAPIADERIHALVWLAGPEAERRHAGADGASFWLEQEQNGAVVDLHPAQRAAAGGDWRARFLPATEALIELLWPRIDAVGAELVDRMLAGHRVESICAGFPGWDLVKDQSRLLLSGIPVPCGTSSAPRLEQKAAAREGPCAW